MSHPLLSWDIYLEGLQRRKDLSRELNAIQKIMKYNNWGASSDFIDNALIWENKTVVITDENLYVVHATENILKMTGYKSNEIIGKKPSMFQGEKTEIAVREKIRTAVIAKIPFEAWVTNYKKDGNTYKCHINGFPMFNKNGKLVNFIAIEKAV